LTRETDATVKKKAKKLQRIYFLYWLMLVYIVAALVWWFIELNRQNNQMTRMRTEIASVKEISTYPDTETLKKRKIAQYVGEGITFFLLIVIAAVFIFRAIRRQLKQSQQQQHFMMAITHELKTPIAISKLNLETLTLRKLSEEQKEKLMQNTLEELNRMHSLSNNLLLSSQIEADGYSLHLENLDLGEITERSISDFEKRFPGRKIIFNRAGKINVKGDPFLLEMLVNNLIENAIKYSPRQHQVVIHFSYENGEAKLSVADKGDGIVDSDKVRVFEKFYRTGNDATRQSKGTGLGLYIVNRVALAHKGSVRVTDNPGGGSVFTLTLPSVK